MTKRKDLRGEEVSLSEVERALGAAESWDKVLGEAEKRADTERLRFTIDVRDAANLRSHPAYVRHSLLNCATRVLEAPRAVFLGLRNRGLTDGFAYCGLPVWQYDQNGNRSARPDGMTYVVYADGQRRVFDWDWVRSDPQDPALPVDHEQRFDRRGEPHSATLLGLDAVPQTSEFDQSRAVHSEVGDCIFMYFSDEPSYADRLNEELTLFRALRDKRPLGCKVKNIRSILEIITMVGKWTTESREVKVSVEEATHHVTMPAIVCQSVVRQTGRGVLPKGYYDVFRMLEDTTPEPRVSLAPHVMKQLLERARAESQDARSGA